MEVSSVCLKKSVKCVSRKFSKKKVSRVSRIFVLKFCCCMDLIAATRAEGGLVLNDCQLCYDWVKGFN